MRVTNKFKPIAYIIKQVRENKSDQQPRSVKKTLEFLSETVEAYIQAQSTQSLDDFIY